MTPGPAPRHSDQSTETEQSVKSSPVIPYGAVYYRKSNPPREDWERDYAQAAGDGMNTFRHWFMWSAIETAPGTWDWEECDRQLDLAAENNMQTIIAEQIRFAPDWAYRQFAGCELRTADGRAAASGSDPSAAIAGTPGLCLDHPQVREAAEAFLRALVTRYKDHPGLGGYDLWNECNVLEEYCYCTATVAEFRTWLADKYGTLEELGRVWHRYSLVEWEDVHPPVNEIGYAESLDWRQFRIDHAHEGLRWRAGIVRELDTKNPVIAHGIAASLSQLAPNATDDWRAAAEVDIYGMTWVIGRKGNEPWRQWSAIDLLRSASRGKPFWHAEMQGGPLWLQPQVVGRPREDGRIAQPEDIRYWNLVSLAGGARGVQYLRWRPLLDGPLFGSFGPYGLAGETTKRSAAASELAKWTNSSESAEIWPAQPVQGDIGIVVVPETQLLVDIQYGDATVYSEDVWGAYRAFFDLNVQADYVNIDDIDAYRVLYLPMPLMLTSDHAARIRDWVAAGGTLISEGCPGYFGDNGRVEQRQPGLGFGEVFGVRQHFAEFVPDLLAHGEDTFAMGGTPVASGVYRQWYDLTGGSAVGLHDNGMIAVVEHEWHKGRTLLVGTCPGNAYFQSDGTRGREWFQAVLRWAGVEQHVTPAEAGVTARLSRGEDGLVLWVTNPARQDRNVSLRIGSQWGDLSEVRSLRGGVAASLEGRDVRVEIGGREAVILALR